MKSRLIGNGALRRVYPPDLVDALRREAGLDPEPLSEAALRAGKAADADALFATWGMPALSEDELARALPRLRAVFYAAGSVQAFARPLLARGVEVFSAWGENAVPVAEVAVSQILLANKGFFRFRFGPKDPVASDAERRAAASYPGNLGCRVGLLGAGGRIGSLVARALRAHRVEVLGYDPFLSDARAKELGVRKAGLEEIFETCQTVSNHLADNPATRGLLGYGLFSRMLPTATFLNTGRGAQVVEADLARALREEASVHGEAQQRRLARSRAARRGLAAARAAERPPHAALRRQFRGRGAPHGRGDGRRVPRLAGRAGERDADRRDDARHDGLRAGAPFKRNRSGPGAGRRRRGRGPCSRP